MPPATAGLSHVAEEVEKEGIAPASAFDFLVHGDARGWARMMLTAIDLAQTAYCQLTHELAASMKARRRSDLCSPIPQAD